MKKYFTFSGGVHPPQSKLTSKLPVEILPVSDRVAIPLIQHIGAPARSLVSKGDHVEIGQKIGESGGFVSANIHSSVTGKVIEISPVPHIMGRNVSAVIIETEKKEDSLPEEKTEDWETKDSETLKKAVQEAGIVGMGGAAFPAHVKLSPPAGKKIDVLIINGAECEPFLTADHRLMLERPDDIITGVSILKKILGVKQAIIAVEKNKMDAVEALRSRLNSTGIECRVVKTKYPQGGEKQLINALTKREVPSGGLPMDCGCVVHNIGTTLAVMEAVCMKKPLIERVLTVTGRGVREPKNLKVRIGTSFKEVINACGGLTEDCKKVLSGGPMMGIAQWNLDVPVIKATSGILCLTEKEVKSSKEQPCISCGACVRACPVNLVPTWIVKNAGLKRWNTTEKLGALDCMECGSCAYVCPSKINLVHYLKWAKLEIMNEKKKEKAKAK